MEISETIKRLRQVEFRDPEIKRISKEYKSLSLAGKVKMLGQLKKEKRKSENSDISDIINEIIKGM